jgi:amino acid adenylation domain-containing protein
MYNSLTEYLINSAEKFSDKTAVEFQNQEISYATLLHAAKKWACFLKMKQLQRGDRVVVCTGNCIEAIICFWGTLLADCVISIIDNHQNEEKIAYILNDSSAKVFVVPDQKLYSFSEALSPEQCLIVNLSNKNYLHFNTILDEISDPLLSIFLSFIHLDIDLASIVYTSGSTGEPKGVMLTHRNMLAASFSINSYLKNTEHDRVISALPLSFDYGMYQMILMTAVAGSLILEPHFLLPCQVLKKIEQKKVTAVPVVPSMVPLLKQFQDMKKFDVSSVRYATNTGAALSKNHISILKELFPKAHIFSMYGLTECKRCTYLPPQDIHRKPDSIGIPIPNTEMWIIDEDGNRLPPGEVGEIVVRGQTVMKGYLNKPEATAKKLRPGPMPGELILHTGDYGKMDEEGYFYFCGRSDEVIKSRGMKVSPKEIETTIIGHPEVSEAAAIGVEHEEYGEAIVLFVNEEHPEIAEKLAHYCRKNLETHQQPIAIISVDILPKTTNGKINKKALKEHYLQKHLMGAEV